MADVALEALEKAKMELEDKREAYKTTIALLHQLRTNIKIKEKLILILEQNYKEAIIEEIENIITPSNNTEDM
jgi:exonuclease VII small subunit